MGVRGAPTIVSCCVAMPTSCESVARLWGEHGSWGSQGFGSSCYQTAGQDTADWEGLLHAVVDCGVCELAIAP